MNRNEFLRQTLFPTNIGNYIIVCNMGHGGDRELASADGTFHLYCEEGTDILAELERIKEDLQKLGIAGEGAGT